MTGFQQFQPQSTRVLWEGSPSDVANIATGGRIATAGYKLTEDALHFASGVLSSREESVPLWAIRDVDIIQSMTQKARGVADLRLNFDPSAQGFGQQVVVLKSIKNARLVRDMIVAQANAVRSYWADRYHQQAVAQQRAGAANVQVGQPATTQPASPPDRDDLMAKLSQLGEMKSAGLLTDDEFAAAKAKLLGL